MGKKRGIIILLLSIFFIYKPIYSQAPLKVSLGLSISSNGQIRKLRTHDRARPGDQIQIFIKPTGNMFVYSIFSDDQNSTLLNKNFVDKDSVIILPSRDNFYAFDSLSNIANFTIICSTSKIETIDNLFKNNTQVSSDKWNKIKKNITTKHKTKISEKLDKPFTMAGNVRSNFLENFLNRLPTYSGEKMIIKNYEVQIKK